MRYMFRFHIIHTNQKHINNMMYVYLQTKKRCNKVHNTAPIVVKVRPVVYCGLQPLQAIRII